MKYLPLLLLIFLLPSCSDNSLTEEEYVGKSLLAKIKTLNENTEKIHVVYSKFEGKKLTSQAKSHFNAKHGILSVDRYEIHNNPDKENLVLTPTIIAFHKTIGQVNPQDPGFGPVSITKGFYRMGSTMSNWYPIHKTYSDSIKVLLETFK